MKALHATARYLTIIIYSYDASYEADDLFLSLESLQSQ